jgi:hypothetical protein
MTQVTQLRKADLPSESIFGLEADSSRERLESRRVVLELERLKLERQKTNLEIRLKRREMSVARKSGWQASLSNPLTLAIVGGLITLATTTVANHVSEATKARQALQSDLIKKFVDNPTPQAVRANLRFLVDVGLVPDYANGLRSFLDKNPDSALPSSSPVQFVCGKFTTTNVPATAVDGVVADYMQQVSKKGSPDIRREQRSDGSWSISADFGQCLGLPLNRPASP